MKKYIIFTLLISFLYGCEKKIDWEVKESIKKLVVDASLTNELKKHSVFLSKTRGYDDIGSVEKIQNASIELSDGTNTFTYNEDNNNPGHYYTENEISGEIGKIYTLNIELEEEIGGYDNYSASSEMKPVFEIDSIIASHEEIIDSIFGFEEVYIVCEIKVTGTELESEGDRYLFKLRNNNVLLSDSLGDLPFLSDENINNFHFNEESLFWEDTAQIKVNDTVTVEIHSINDAYTDFLFYYSYEGDPLGLSGPPANVPTNINNGGLGFFVVSGVSKKSAIVFDNLPKE